MWHVHVYTWNPRVHPPIKREIVDELLVSCLPNADLVELPDGFDGSAFIAQHDFLDVPQLRTTEAEDVSLPAFKGIGVVRIYQRSLSRRPVCAYNFNKNVGIRGRIRARASLNFHIVLFAE